MGIKMSRMINQYDSFFAGFSCQDRVFVISTVVSSRNVLLQL